MISKLLAAALLFLAASAPIASASSLPPVNSSSPVAQSGSPVTRALGNWQGEIASNRSLNPWAPIPLVSPPLTTATFGKGDGLSTVASNAGGSGYVTGDTVTLAGATCSVAPVVSVTASGGVVTGASIVVPGVCSADATSFTQASTSGSGTGATFTGTMTTFKAASMANPARNAVNASLNGGCLLDMVEPRANIGSSGYYGSSAYIGTHATIECESDAPQIDFQILAFNTALDVLMDGQRVQATPFTTDSSGSGWVLTLAPSVGGVHNWKIIGDDLAIDSVNVGAAYSVWVPNLRRRPLHFVLGDSYTFGTCAPQVTQGYSQVLGQVIGADMLPDGIGGTGWTSTSANLPQTRVSADLALRTQAANVIEFDNALGYNDAAGWPGNAATITTNVQATIAAERAINPVAKIVFILPWTPLGPTTNLTGVANTIKTAVAGYGVQTIDPSGIITTSNDVLYGCGDSTHPGNNGASGYQGHLFLGNRLGELFGTIN